MGRTERLYLLRLDIIRESGPLGKPSIIHANRILIAEYSEPGPD